VTRDRSPDFDVQALYVALDVQRQARGMSWAQVAREVSGLFAGTRAKPISPSTIVGMRKRANVEGDGVLQMLLWLKRTPESFVPGHSEFATDTATLPQVNSGQILRFDTKAMYAALDAQRIARAMTWTQLASDIGGFNAAGLTRLADGGRTAFPQVMRIVRWLGRPAATFTCLSDW
jgi:hypothetical protein